MDFKGLLISLNALVRLLVQDQTTLSSCFKIQISMRNKCLFPSFLLLIWFLGFRLIYPIPFDHGFLVFTNGGLCHLYQHCLFRGQILYPFDYGYPSKLWFFPLYFILQHLLRVFPYLLFASISLLFTLQIFMVVVCAQGVCLPTIPTYLSVWVFYPLR